MLPVVLSSLLPLRLAHAEEGPPLVLESSAPLATSPALAPAADQVPPALRGTKDKESAVSAGGGGLPTSQPWKEQAQDAPVDLDQLQQDAKNLKTVGGQTPVLPGDQTSKPQGLPSGADKTGVSNQAISVPQGTGKIQGMGESFSAQLSTGIATFSVPFALPPARGAAQPSLGLSYSSSSGHGLAGMGWELGAPYIARQTDRGLPRFEDKAQWHPEQDRFVFNGGQELVPVCDVGLDLACSGALKGLTAFDLSSEATLAAASNDGKPGFGDEVMPSWAAGWQYFRPRVEGSFLRFFWSPDHRTWRVQDKGGSVMELGVPYGTSDGNALESDPADSSRVFRWNLALQYDQEGSEGARPNRVVYRYLHDGGMAYLSDIFSTSPVKNPTTSDLPTFAHHTRLVYEQRTDPTRSYRRGWATDSNLRLTRVDVASKPFGGQGLDPVAAPRQLVRRYHLAYDSASHVSLLASVQVEGRCAGSDASSHPAESKEGTLPETTGCPRLPAMTFGYQHVTPLKADGSPGAADLPGYEGFDERVRSVEGSPNHSLDEALTDLFDINGDALPDVLVTAPGTYSGQHGLFLNGGGFQAGRFWPSCTMPVQGVQGDDASVLTLSNANVAALDLDGDGVAKLLHMPKAANYAVYTATPQGTCGKQTGWAWKGRKIASASGLPPQIDFGKDAAQTRVLDVNGDGLVDLVRLTGTRIETYFALGRYPGGDGQFGRGKWSGATSASLSSDPVAFCVPWSSGPLSFDGPDVKLADMNGDGLADIVRVRPGDVRYWPGRGNGFFGTGNLSDCKEGTFGPERSVAMGDAPVFTDVTGEALRLDDVNGDGLDDLVQIRFDAVDLWLNVDGLGWTQDRHIFKNAPKAPSALNRVRMVDLNGSGTRDFVWGDGLDYKYVDLLGGTRPWVLTSVSNGLGKTTELQFASSVELMLAAAKAGKPWASTTPMPLHVVVKSTERDNLSVAGRPAGVYVTEYSYRDPVYDGQQREFRGFRHAEARRLGDENSPTSTSASDFLLGECKDDDTTDGVNPCAVSERWRDNPREALKGLPVVAETFDEKGASPSTTHHTYRLRQLYTGLDGRRVVHAFELRTDTFLYDTAPFSADANPALASLPEVETQFTGVVQVQNGGVRVRSSKGTVQAQSHVFVDVYGNRVLTRNEGCVAGCDDGTIWGVTVPGRPANDPTGWLWRTVEGWVPHGTSRRHQSRTEFDAKGRPVRSRAVLEGTLPLDRFHETGGVVAPAPAGAAQDTGPDGYVVGETDYDAFGLPIESRSFPAPGEVRRRQVGYDDDYADFPLTETIFAGLDGSVELTAQVVSYDRGLGAPLEVRDLHGETTRVVHDGFGRMAKLFRPQDAPDGSCTVGTRASVEIEYLLTADPQKQPFSLLHTRTQRGKTPDGDDYQEAWAYVDGMGRTLVTLSEADPDAGDAGKWVVQGLTDYDQKGAAQRTFLPWFWSGDDPKAYPLSQDPNTLYGRQRYDAFGRQLQTFSLDGIVSLLTKHHALCSEAWDAADLEAGPHQGTFASTCQDGHGRTTRTTERVHDAKGKLELRHTIPSYLPSGEVVAITRQRNDEVATQVTRWMRFDSQGRMVLNVEPNTSAGFVATPLLEGAPPTSLKAWRYAYNQGGDLIGTSDARGCGTNYHYDAAGRLVAEDYSPCRAIHEAYTAPDLLTGTGTEVFTRYDMLDPEAAAVGQGFTGSPGLLLGRVASVSDRGAKVMSEVDCRGRVRAMAKQVAKPPSVTAGLMTDTTPLSMRYAPRWYVKKAQYDGADRNVLTTTGATSPELQRASVQGETSTVTTTFSKRGLVVSVGGSYGALVTSVVKDADGLTTKIGYGDLAKTETVFTYDQRRRVHTVQTYRGPPSCWKVNQLEDPPPECKGYAAGEFYLSGQPSTFPLLLEDSEFSYDAVDNPVELRDWRLPHEWPAGAKPVSRKAEYDDLNRLVRLDYLYANGKDAWTSPFAAEDAAPPPAPGDKPTLGALPRQSFSDRLLWQTYAFDWLGNSIASDDDAHGFYDRSLGTVTQGTPNKGPYQIKAASNQTASKKPNEGRLEAKYDAAGNLTGLLVLRSPQACLPTGKGCQQLFHYDWDEVGRLASASRWDLAPGEVPTGAWDGGVPASQPAVTLRHSYDGSDQRTVKEASSCVPQAVGGCAIQSLHTAYVFDSLDLRRTAFTAGGEADYEASAETEAAYLVGNGVRLARLHQEPTLPAVGGDGLHVLLEMADHLGSASTVLDKATGELAERVTYQGYGSTESDYRPGRWGAFREDYRFTGKEEDSEVGLTYFGKRYLNPALGRWASADPLTIHALGADLNAYAYVHGAVLKATDPIGLNAATQTSDTNNLDDQERAEQELEGGGSTPGLPAAPSAPTPSSPVSRGAKTLREARNDGTNAGLRNSVVDLVLGPAKLVQMGPVGWLPGLKPLTDAVESAVKAPEPVDVSEAEAMSGGEALARFAERQAYERSHLGFSTVFTLATMLGPLAGSGARAASEVGEASSASSALAEIRRPSICPGGTCECFGAGTPVWTPIGPVPIEGVSVGDLVLSRDDRSGDFSWQPVERIFITQNRETLLLSVAWDGGNEILRITAGHPVWVESQGWLGAGYLQEGDRIARADAGGWATVQSLHRHLSMETVYNFSIENTHTYFVGSSLLWVHNTCPKIDPSGGWAGEPLIDLKSLVKNGKVSASDLEAAIPLETPNSWEATNPLGGSYVNAEGYKFRWAGADGTKYEVWAHGKNPNAPAGSNAANGPTVRIRIGNRFVLEDGSTVNKNGMATTSEASGSVRNENSNRSHIQLIR